MPADIDVYSTYTDPAKLRQFVRFCNKIKIFRAPSARIKEVNCGLVGAGAYSGHFTPITDIHSFHIYQLHVML